MAQFRAVLASGRSFLLRAHQTKQEATSWMHAVNKNANKGEWRVVAIISHTPKKHHPHTPTRHQVNRFGLPRMRLFG